MSDLANSICKEPNPEKKHTYSRIFPPYQNHQRFQFPFAPSMTQVGANLAPFSTHFLQLHLKERHFDHKPTCMREFSEACDGHFELALHITSHLLDTSDSEMGFLSWWGGSLTLRILVLLQRVCVDGVDEMGKCLRERKRERERNITSG